MKKFLSRLLFSFVIALKNIFYYKFKSLLLILSFIALLSTLMISFSSRSFISSYFINTYQKRYQDLDMVMKVSPNSNSRYFSIRELLDDQDKDDFFSQIIPFFEVTTLVEINEEKEYVNVMSSSVSNLNKVSNLNSSISFLANDEVIITKSLSTKFSVTINDIIYLHVGDSSKDYKIVTILDDGGLFSDDTIFINKDSSIKFFLEALNPSLASLPNQVLTNLYNVVYFELANDVNFDQANNYLKSFTPYSNLLIDYTYSVNAINHMVNRNTAAFRIILIAIVIAVILVMQTTLLLYFNDKVKSFSVVTLLGGSLRFNYFLITIEFLILLSLSFISSIFISNFIINIGFSFVGMDYSYNIQNTHIIYSLLTFLILFILIGIYQFTKLKGESVVQNTKENFYKERVSLKYFIFLLILSLILFVISKVSQHNLSYLAIISSLIFLFSFSFGFLKLIINKSSKKGLNKSFMFHLKISTSNKAFIQYLSVSLISFLSIFLAIFANHHMNHRIIDQQGEYNIDYILTNFATRYDETYNDLESLDNILFKDKVLLFNNIEIINESTNIELAISIDPSKISQYFNLNIKDEYIDSLNNNTKKMILLPNRYQSLNGYKVGDTILVNISPSKENVEFTIGGFFEKHVSNLAFVNLSLFTEFTNSSERAILVNEIKDSNSLKQDLISRYSMNLVYIVDFRLLVLDNISEIINATTYLTYIFIIIIFCFMLSIFNHSLLLFELMQKNYSRIYVVGSSIKKLIKMVFYESILLYSIILFSSTISFYMLSSEMTNIIKLTNEYEFIVLEMKTLIIGFFITFIIHFISKMVYIIKLFNIKPSIVLKNYE